MSIPNIHDIPTAAAGLIRERGWAQGSYEADDGSLCLHGAIRACAPQKGDAEIVGALARHQGYSEEWNDHNNRTEPEVLTALSHIDTSDAALEKTFGPQWEAIVALIRRAAVFTSEESDTLNAAWTAAWDDTWEVSRQAARDASRDASRDAAWNAAWNATWGAARAAAQALVVRDLIGHRRFTQEHYDTLTGPWATVIGPAHPDDKEHPHD